MASCPGPEGAMPQTPPVLVCSVYCVLSQTHRFSTHSHVFSARIRAASDVHVKNMFSISVYLSSSTYCISSCRLEIQKRTDAGLHGLVLLFPGENNESEVKNNEACC